MALALGTVYADIRLQLATLEADVGEAMGMVDGLAADMDAAMSAVGAGLGGDLAAELAPVAEEATADAAALDDMATAGNAARDALAGIGGEDAAALGEVGAAATEADAGLVSLDASTSAADAGLASIAGSAGEADAGLAGIGASAGEADAGLSGVDASASSADAGLASIAASAGEADAGLAGIAGSASEADAALSSLDASAGGADAALASTGEGAAAMEAGMAGAGSAAGEAGAQLEEASGEAGNAGDNLDEAGKKGAGAGAGMMVLGLAAVEAGMKIVEMGAGAQSALSQVAALTGASQAQMDQYTSGLEAMSGQLGVTMQDAANGLYYVVSAGFQGADALNVLKVSMEAAKAGGADMTTVGDALTSSLNAYGASAQQASTYSDVLIQAVTSGKQTFADLASSIGVAAVTGHTAGFSFQEVAAAEATMTQSGLNAHRAVMNLDFLMRSVGLSADAVAAKAKKLGIEGFDTAAFSSMSLIQKLQYLQQVSKGNKTAFETLVGGANGLTAAELLLGKGGQTYIGILNQMQHSQGATERAFEVSEKTFEAGVDHLKAAFSVLAYTIVAALSPVISGPFTAAANALSAAFAWLTKNTWAAIPVLGAFAALLSGGVLVALEGFGFKLETVVELLPKLLAFSGWVLVILAIGAALIYAYQHSEMFRNIVAGLLDVVTLFAQTAGPMLSAALQTAGTWLSRLAQIIGSALGPPLNAVGAFIRNIVIPALMQLAQNTTLVRSVLIGLGVALGVLAFTLLPVLIGFLIGGATAAWAFIAPFLVAAAPFIAVGAAVAALAFAVQYAYTHFAPFRDAVNAAWKALQQFGQEVLSRAIPVIRQLLPILQQLGQQLVTNVVAGLRQLQAIWNAVWPGLATVLQGVWNVIVGVVRIAWALLSGLIKIGLDILSGNWRQAWTDLGTMLVGVWNGIKQTVQGAWQIIEGVIRVGLGLLQALWTAIWTAIVNFLRGIWNGISSWLSGIWSSIQARAAAFMAAVQAVFTAAWNFLVGLIQGAITTIVGWFSWLYNHNYYFKDLVDFIVNAFNFLRSTAIAIWSALSSFLASVWNAIKSAAISAWNAITSAVRSAWDTISGAISSAAAKVVSLLQNAWNTVKSDATNAWNSFVGMISGLAGRVGGAIQSGVVSPIQNALSNLASMAAQWGANVIKGFIGGIQSMAGAVGSAASGIAGKVAGFLGFHSPAKEGPGKDADTWAPNLVRMLAAGLLEGQPVLGEAASTLAGALRRELGVNSPLAGGAPGSLSATNFGALSATSSASAMPQQLTIQVPVTVSVDGTGNAQQQGQQFGQQVGAAIQNALAQHGIAKQ